MISCSNTSSIKPISGATAANPVSKQTGFWQKLGDKLKQGLRNFHSVQEDINLSTPPKVDQLFKSSSEAVLESLEIEKISKDGYRRYWFLTGAIQSIIGDSCHFDVDVIFDAYEDTIIQQSVSNFDIIESSATVIEEEFGANLQPDTLSLNEAFALLTGPRPESGTATISTDVGTTSRPVTVGTAATSVHHASLRRHSVSVLGIKSVKQQSSSETIGTDDGMNYAPTADNAAESKAAKPTKKFPTIPFVGSRRANPTGRFAVMPNEPWDYSSSELSSLAPSPPPETNDSSQRSMSVPMLPDASAFASVSSLAASAPSNRSGVVRDPAMPRLKRRSGLSDLKNKGWASRLGWRCRGSTTNNISTDPPSVTTHPIPDHGYSAQRLADNEPTIRTVVAAPGAIRGGVGAMARSGIVPPGSTSTPIRGI